MGVYPSDTVPQLAKYSFAISNLASSKDRGEHWIMIARLDNSYYFADSLGKKTYSFPTIPFGLKQINLLLSNKKSIGEWFLES